ncbi:hypothetical protein RRG08_005147 [Elysia crispata]|uniref:HAT C-terminal dimerisation domain-containing protein n=1 Tax=Elysia crispata TaxID=231223 RepID=A0AAE1DGS1_9GAST|nr:hypothetical protein RRG08_005147 [Elysia crispata]
MATILDPRYKGNGSQSADSSDRAVRKLKEVASSFILSQCSVAQEEVAAEEPVATPAKKPSLLWANSDRQVKEKHHDCQVRRHLETACLSRDAKPLDYWRDHCASLPRLSPVARDVLSFPATSVSSERLFSKAGELISN